MSDPLTSNFPTDVYATRLKQAQQGAQTAGLDGLIIGTGAELAYLTGSWISTHERLTALVIPASGTPTIILPAVDRGDLALSAIPELDITVRGWVDGEDAHDLAITALGVTEFNALGIGSSITADHLIPIQNIVGPQCRFSLAVQVLKELFVSKDAVEVEQLRGAGAAIDKVHAQVPALLIDGRTEADVARDLEALILQEHDAVDFIIVGSGPNGANPHHSFSNRVLRNGDIVVVDIGGTFGPGYHSDCTRTYIVGGDPQAADPEFIKFYEVLHAAQLAALAHIRPGVTAASVDAAARDAIASAGYGDNFIHRTGHGIGLSTHEEPFIMAGNELVLEPGMAFSVEPGIYIDGIHGARIEDIVVVTQTGCETLNNEPKALR
ncbi:putative dipeptidase PepE [Corynebacterium deserti GIMN1.010]|uniref:Putative dipeptidase PepE n=1 Tax=Corynebacterium deserti GIMN1.010 TaxID=931089 RepID=A0A0M3Q9K3_9CORY|nr:Xaa-Pro peptidase family protein [Corynebacterium deserti]ALC05849.1 putative dipeptidase PepE [Corynebacterium deserti GIMN1.010]